MLSSTDIGISGDALLGLKSDIKKHKKALCKSQAQLFGQTNTTEWEGLNLWMIVFFVDPTGKEITPKEFPWQIVSCCLM